MWVAAQTSCGFVLLEGEGALDAGRLRQAIANASAVHPGSRLALHGHGPWAHWRETDCLPPLEEIDGSAWDGCDGASAPFSDQAHLDVRHGPSVSYVLLHGARTRLIQRSHHATMDGLGALEFLRDVFRSLRGETPLGASGAETDLGLARRLGGKPRQIASDCLKPFPGNSNGNSGSTWQRLHISAPPPDQPLSRSILAIARIAREYADGEVLIDLPANFRHQFPEIRNIGNLTGSLRLSVPADATLDSIRHEITNGIGAGRHADAVVSAAGMRFLPLSLMRSVAARQAHKAVLQHRFTPSAVVSNLGRFHADEYSGATFRASSCNVIPPAYDGVPLFLVLSGSQYGYELCARAPIALANEGRLNDLLHAVAHRMLVIS